MVAPTASHPCSRAIRTRLSCPSCSAPRLVGIRPDGVLHRFLELSEPLHELRLELVEQTEEVLHHQDLSVAPGPGADAHPGDRKLPRDLPGEIGGGAPPHPPRKPPPPPRPPPAPPRLR